MEGQKPAGRPLYAFYTQRVAPTPLDAEIIAQCYGAPNIAGDFDKLEASYRAQNPLDPLTEQKLKRIPELKKAQTIFNIAAMREGKRVDDRFMHIGDLVDRFESVRSRETDTPGELDVAEAQEALKYVGNPRKKNAPAA